MIYTITKLVAGIKVSPAVPVATHLEIEAKLGDRLTELSRHLSRYSRMDFTVSSRYSSSRESFTMLSMAEGTATDADIEMVRQILQKHEDEDAASQLRMARHREQSITDLGIQIKEGDRP